MILVMYECIPDAKAAKSAQAVNALAYTVGHNVVFGAGNYLPKSKSGQRLIADELTHVVQQSFLPSGMLNPKLDFDGELSVRLTN